MAMDIELRSHPKARRLSVRVHPGGRVTVTVPKRCSQTLVNRFLNRHQSWIERTRTEMTEKLPSHSRSDARRAYLVHKETARRLAYALIARFAPFYGVSVRAVSVRDQKSRWGSCARTGRLSFNYRIALLPPRLAEYVVVHELCHLAEFNHSSRFWSLVAKTVPEHRLLRNALHAQYPLHA